MLTKTTIARKVADEGITVIIANGKKDHILVDLLQHPAETVLYALYSGRRRSIQREKVDCP